MELEETIQLSVHATNRFGNLKFCGINLGSGLEQDLPNIRRKWVGSIILNR